MSTTRKVVIARTVILASLLALAGAFAYAVYDDRTDGRLMDDEGVIDTDLIEPLDQ